MKAEFKAVNPQDIEFEMVLRMTLAEWQFLAEKLKGETRDPVWRLRWLIDSMNEQALKNFKEESTDA